MGIVGVEEGEEEEKEEKIAHGSRGSREKVELGCCCYLYGLRIPGEMLAFLERGRLDLSLKSGCEPKCGALLLLLLLPLVVV